MTTKPAWVLAPVGAGLGALAATITAGRTYPIVVALLWAGWVGITAASIIAARKANHNA